MSVHTTPFFLISPHTINPNQLATEYLFPVLAKWHIVSCAEIVERCRGVLDRLELNKTNPKLGAITWHELQLLKPMPMLEGLMKLVL